MPQQLCIVIFRMPYGHIRSKCRGLHPGSSRQNSCCHCAVNICLADHRQAFLRQVAEGIAWITLIDQWIDIPAVSCHNRAPISFSQISDCQLCGRCNLRMLLRNAVTRKRLFCFLHQLFHGSPIFLPNTFDLRYQLCPVNGYCINFQLVYQSPLVHDDAQKISRARTDLPDLHIFHSLYRTCRADKILDSLLQLRIFQPAVLQIGIGQPLPKKPHRRGKQAALRVRLSISISSRRCFIPWPPYQNGHRKLPAKLNHRLLVPKVRVGHKQSVNFLLPEILGCPLHITCLVQQRLLI